MVRFLLRLAINAFALWVAIQIVPGITYDGTNLSLLIIALIFGVVNAFIRPLLVILTCPLVILTFGLFIFVINGLMLALTAWISNSFGLGLFIDGFWPTVWGALIISIVSGVINALIKSEEEDKAYRRRYDRRGSA